VLYDSACGQLPAQRRGDRLGCRTQADPAIFVLYLLITRRYRAAATAGSGVRR